MDEQELETGQESAATSSNDDFPFFANPPEIGAQVGNGEQSEQPASTEEAEQVQEQPEVQKDEKPKPEANAGVSKPGRKAGSKLYTADEVAKATGKWKELRAQIKDKDDKIAELTSKLEAASTNTNTASKEELAARDEQIAELKKQLRISNVYQTEEFQTLKKSYNDAISELSNKINVSSVSPAEIEIALLIRDDRERWEHLKNILLKCEEDGYDNHDLNWISNEFSKTHEFVVSTIDKKEKLKKDAEDEKAAAASAMKKSGLSRDEVNKLFGYEIISSEDGGDVMNALAKKGKALREERDSYKTKNDELMTQLDGLKKKLQEIESKQKGELQHLRDKENKRKAAQPSVGRNSAPPSGSRQQNSPAFSMTFEEFRRSMMK